jgi:phosphatidylserine/phosphatidylglycerophosphate/cardiolipin synthase-like enzyme
MMPPQAIIAGNFPRMVTPLIEAAKHSIDVIVYDWRWYPSISGSTVSKFNQAFVAAQKRGVKVRCLVNNAEIALRLKSHGIQAHQPASEKMLHTKMILVDGTLLVIGSHNFTERAFSMNEEASILVEFPSDQHEFALYFEHLWCI